MFFAAWEVEELLDGDIGVVDHWGGYYDYTPSSDLYTLRGFVQFRTLKDVGRPRVIIRTLKGTTVINLGNSQMF